MKSGITRNKRLKTQAKIASNILKERRSVLDKALIEAQNKEIQQKKRIEKKEKRLNRLSRGSAAIRYVVLAMIALSLVVSLIASYSVSWFLMTMDGPGASISTGHISLRMRSYKKGTIYNLNRFVDSDVTNANSVELYSGLQQEIGLFADSNGIVDDVYFVVEKKSDSIDIETYLGFTIEGVNGGEVNDYIGGFMFQLENVTEAVSAKNETTTTVYNKSTNSVVQASDITSIEKKLYSFIQSNQSNNALPRAMSFIGTDSGTNTATNLIDGDVCVYRLTTYLSEQARQSSMYLNKAFTIKVSLRAGQEGSMTGGTEETYYVSNMSELNEAISNANPGDTITINSNISYNGDLVITCPITLDLNGKILTVNGNLVITSSYSGHIEIDTTDENSLLAVKKVGIIGGNINIDAPACSCKFVGKNDIHYADIACAGEITINSNSPAATEYDTESTENGFTVDGSRICSVVSGVVDATMLNGLLIKNDTRISITEGTTLKSITAESASELVSIVNKGSIEEINLRSVNAIFDSSNSIYCTLSHIPQIYIDNFGTISSAIHLPTNAFVFAYDALNDVYTGNTRIVSEFGSGVLHVDGSSYFTDSHIESVSKNVIDVYNDGTFLKVYYTDFVPGDEVEIDLETIFNGSTEYPDIYHGYFFETGRSASTVTNVKIITASDKVMTASDYAFMRGTLTSLVTLDLSEAESQNNIIPDNAFRDLTVLSSLTLPTSTVSIGNNAVTGTVVYDLYLPSGITTEGITSTSILGVKYVHPMNTNSAITNLMEGGVKYIFAPDAIMFTQYRNAYYDINDPATLSYIFKEATLSKDGNFFYRRLTATTMEFAVWVGLSEDTTDVSLEYMNADGSNYYIVSIDDYAFYNKFTSSDKSLVCSNKLATIGDYAFFGCNSVVTVNLQSPVLSSIGYKAFGDCTGLENATIDGVSGTALTLNDRPSYLAEQNLAIGNFAGCTNLTSLTLKHVNKVKSKTLYFTQTDLLPLTTLTVEYAESIEEYAFCKYTGGVYTGSNTLISLNISNVGSIGSYAFRNTSSLLYAIIKNTPTVGAEVFASCQNLKAVSAPETVTIGLKLFEGCSALEVASLPKLENITGSTSESNANTFYGCTSLKYLDTGIPSIGYCRNFVNSALNFNTWLIHSENYVSASASNPDVFPTGYLPTSLADSSLIFISTRMYNNMSADIKNHSVSFGTLSAADFTWADHESDGADRWYLSVGNGNLYLSDFGMGDYLLYTSDSLTTVYRCLLEQITGDTTMPNVALDEGTTTIGEKAFQYLSATPTVSTSAEKTIFRMPTSVTRIGLRSFWHCELLGVEGDGVTFIGQSAFEASAALRWAKFPKCCELGRSEGKTVVYAGVYSYTAYDVATFYNCSNLAVLEIGIINKSLYPTDSTRLYFGMLCNCRSIKYVIVHTENDIPDIYNESYFLGYSYMEPYVSTWNQLYLPAYKIILSTTSKSGTNYYSSAHWPDSLLNRIISTSTVMANEYTFADDKNSFGVSTYSLDNSWELADIGYGDYLCSFAEGKAKLLVPLLLSNNIYGSSSYTYSTPDYTVDGFPITQIGDNVYKNISFIDNCKIKIADTTQYIGDYAFEGAYGSTGTQKSITEVDLNLVVSLGEYSFKGIATLQKVKAGESIRSLGSKTFSLSTANLTEIRLETNHAVLADNIFNDVRPNNNLHVFVYSNVFLSDYQSMGFWGGPEGNQSISNAVATQLNLTGQASFSTIGLSYSSNGFRYYYTEYTDVLSGVVGYQITSITIVDPAQRSISIPSALPDSAGAFKPVLSIATGAFADLYSQNCLATRLELPKYLQTIDAGMLKQIWPNLQEYAIATSYTFTGLGREIDLQVNFSTIDGVLYSADGLVLISCPPGKTGTLTVSSSSNLNTVSVYAFFNTHLTNLNLDSAHNYIVISNDAFVSSSTLIKITVNKGAVFMNAAFNAVSGLTEIRLPSTIYRSQFVGALFQNMAGCTAQILVPQSMMSQYAYAISSDPTLASRLDDIANHNP